MDPIEWHSWKAPGRRPPQPPYAESGQAPSHAPTHGPTHVPATWLNEKFIQVERKLYTISLKENERGRFLRIMEENAHKVNTLVIPATGLEDFQTVINEMVKTHQATPPQNVPPPEA